MANRDQVIEIAKQCFDPEIPVNIWDLGLIYDIDINSEGDAINITMSLTSQACPAAQSIPDNLKQKIMKELKPNSCEVKVVFEPLWTPDRMTDEAKAKLGIEDA